MSNLVFSYKSFTKCGCFFIVPRNPLTFQLTIRNGVFVVVVVVVVSDVNDASVRRPLLLRFLLFPRWVFALRKHEQQYRAAVMVLVVFVVVILLRSAARIIVSLFLSQK